MTLAELDTNKNIKITWLSEGITKEVSESCARTRICAGNLTGRQTPLDVFVSKAGTTEDLIQVLVRKAGIPSEAEGGRIRVYETSSHRFHRELGRGFSVLNINEYSTLYAERIPKQELDAEENHLIQVFHFHSEPSRVHGVPFRFLLIEVRADLSAAIYYFYVCYDI